MQTSIFYLILLSQIINIALGCSGLQTRRTCSCKAMYTFENQLTTEKELSLPLTGYDDCGINLGCEKKLDCSTYCLRLVSEILGGNQTYLTQTGQDKLCTLIMKSQSLSENGIVLRSQWTYSGCETNTNLVISGLCCSPRCNCELGMSHNLI